MKHWHIHNQDFFEQECSFIHRNFPDVEISINAGKVLLVGTFPLVDPDGSIIKNYRLGVEFPIHYPDWIPNVIMLEPGVEKNPDRHIESDGKGCLCLPHSALSYFPEGITFERFWEVLVVPWLIGQAHYEEYNEWPFDAWDHGMEGILQGFVGVLGFDDEEIVRSFLKLLVRKNPVKGHILCPCGSGKKIRNCHQELYKSTRAQIPRTAMSQYRKYF